MIVLCAGGGLFALGFAIHAILWRVRLPRHQWRALMLIFAGVGSVAVLLAVVLGPPSLAMTMPGVVLALLLFSSLALSYVILFSALEADSPTLAMLERIWRSGSEGVPEAALAADFREQTFPATRLEQMSRDGLIEGEPGCLRVTPLGRRLALPVRLYRHLLGREDAVVRD